MLPGRAYILKTEGRSVTATLARPRYRINVNNYERQPADTLALNDIASRNISLDRAIAFDPYEANRTTGSFILIDPETNATAGVGMIKFALRRSHNIHWQALDVDKTQRAAAKGQRPVVLWFTGLSDPANRPSPTLSRKSCTPWGGIRCCLMATMYGMV